ncbi:MAG: cytochrome C [Bacteroidales bacterium]|nr:cytochrome C [Bacteroidales bacterium]
MKKNIKHLILFFGLLFTFSPVFGQLSPGELSKAHASLEGLNNCTKCHVLGDKETSSKCLECHTEIKTMIDKKEGYHASLEVKGQKCAKCHGEHFGRDFKLIHFDKDTFDHNLSGYKLVGKHSKIKCVDCHKPELIHHKISKRKDGNTYLGLGTDCLSCHDDFHQKTLSSNCTSCHNQEAFRPAPGFNHSQTKFPLVGKHQSVKCVKCHKMEERNGKKFQQFKGVAFARCTSCHEDVHKNKFGNDCLKCHNQFSFHQVKQLSSFNHDRTDYPLRGKHANVDCKKCHTTGNYTKPLKFNRCSNCHEDYHKKQFVKNGSSPDCSNCHSVEGFSPSTYGITQHNQTKFALKGSHMATPCFACHKTSDQWNFGNMSTRCIDCHDNIHKNYMDARYIPNGNCKTCHSENEWNQISFDHNTTNFALLGKHKQVTCQACHFRKDKTTKPIQQFKWKKQECTNCHTDVHYDQFDKNGITECLRCHTNENWKPEKFDHNTARFKLDGKHKGLACIQCHKTISQGAKKYIEYKFKDISCASCH